MAKMTARKLEMLTLVDCIYRKALEEGDNQSLCIACILTSHNLQTRSLKYAKAKLQEMTARWQGHEKELNPLETMLMTLAH